MYPRVTTFKLDPARLGEIPAKFKETTPAARTLTGAVDIYAAWRADGQGSVTAIYKSKADADAAAASIQELWGGLSGLLQGAPSTEVYDSVEHWLGSAGAVSDPGRPEGPTQELASDCGTPSPRAPPGSPLPATSRGEG